ncbi:ankyrin repeat-containing protein ITN1-like [Pistacia vera]|uniref:ankyrin repeat-containing protein ITN1-like n=1 Tax=Pistacia vera TaxID=55513 RepID=UPI001263A844|nr:ankyrin repeat-containing protein ITN1-like [Pistacia vera]
MTKEQLAIQNRDGNNAFFLVAASGRMELATIMLAKNEELPSIRGVQYMLPIHIAAKHGHKEMIGYLYEVTKEKLAEEDGVDLLHSLISRTDLFDVALTLLKERPILATVSLSKWWLMEAALHILAGTAMMSPDFANHNQQGILKTCFNLFSSSNKLPHEKLPPKALELLKLLLEKIDCRDDWIDEVIYLAVEQENVEFLSLIICDYPELIRKVKGDTCRQIFRNAALKRQKDIFKLIDTVGPSFKKTILQYKDDDYENILHLAATSAPSDQLDTIPGVALQMQQELLWFKEVSNVLNPSAAQAKNKQGKTPKALFNKKHKRLKEKGEKWMKGTANSCMIVAALIATVVFAAAFTVPGGTKEESGTPHFVHKVSFTIFVISDAVSLVTSVCSILTFLSILTFRYAEEDFLLELPKKLIVGLATLLLSIAAMTVVFCATIFIVFKDGKMWVPILVTAIASLPVILFTKQQRRLLFDVALSTYKISQLFDDEGKARKHSKFFGTYYRRC